MSLHIVCGEEKDSPEGTEKKKSTKRGQSLHVSRSFSWYLHFQWPFPPLHPSHPLSVPQNRISIPEPLLRNIKLRYLTVPPSFSTYPVCPVTLTKSTLWLQEDPYRRLFLSLFYFLSWLESVVPHTNHFIATIVHSHALLFLIHLFGKFQLELILPFDSSW